MGVGIPVYTAPMSDPITIMSYTSSVDDPMSVLDFPGTGFAPREENIFWTILKNICNHRYN